MSISRITTTKSAIAVAMILIAIAVAYRLFPHPANFTAITAVALFAGTILPRRYALAVPLIAIVVSDVFIGLHSLFLVTWATLVVVTWLSHQYLRNISSLRVMSASVGASALFFLTSNFAVWVEGRLYDHTWSGFVTCFYNALPFFRSSLLGDLLFSGILFGSYALIHKLASTKHPLRLV